MRRNVLEECRLCRHAEEHTLAECMEKCNLLFATVKTIETDRRKKQLETLGRTL